MIEQVQTGGGLWPIVLVALIVAAIVGLVLWHRRNPSAADRAAQQAKDDLTSLLHKGADTIGALTKTVREQGSVIASPPVQAAINAQADPIVLGGLSSMAGRQVQGGEIMSPVPQTAVVQPAAAPFPIATINGAPYYAVTAQLYRALLGKYQAEYFPATPEGITRANAYLDAVAAREEQQTEYMTQRSAQEARTVAFSNHVVVPDDGSAPPNLADFNARAVDEQDRWQWFNSLNAADATPLENYLTKFYKRSSIKSRIQYAEQQNPRKAYPFDPATSNYVWAAAFGD